MFLPELLQSQGHLFSEPGEHCFCVQLLEVAHHVLVQELQKRHRTGWEELDLYEVIQYLYHPPRLDHMQGTVHQKKAPFRQLAVRKVFLNGGCEQFMQPLYKPLPCGPSFHIIPPHDRQSSLVHVLFLECTRGPGMVH